MTELTYLNFDLWIGRAAEGYVAKGRDAHGREATVDFRMPFSEPEVEDFWLRVGLPGSLVRDDQGDVAAGPGAGDQRSDVEPQVEISKRAGGSLFEALFHGDLRSCLRGSREQADREGAGLRIRLRLADVPELANLPWEYLYDHSAGRFFALSVASPVVRYLERPERLQPLAVRPPLKMLVMVASPGDHEPLEAEREWRRLNQALGDLKEAGLIELERLEGATLAALQLRLRRRQATHLLHFIGHGDFDPRSQEGVLILEDESGSGVAVSGEDFGVVLRDHAPRLVVLNACKGARTSRRDPFAGVAQALIRQGVPAVVAMQTEIPDDFALTLARELYGALADGYPVDAGLTEARKALAGRRHAAWGVPVLYLRAPDGRILDVEPAAGAGETSDGDPVAEPTGTSGTPDPKPATMEVPPAPPPAGDGPWRFLLDHLKEVAALAAAVPALVYGLGLLAHRSREGLLGLEEPLSYPHQDAVLVSLDVLWSLPANALLALFCGEPWLLLGAWGSLAALLLVPAVDRWLPAARRPLAAGSLLVLIWLLLLFAARFYSAALYPRHSGERPGPELAQPLARNLVALTEFESVSWLKNDSQRNADRRQALAGLAGWLLLAAGWTGGRAYRRRDLPRRLSQVLATFYLGLALVIAGMVPRAYAITRWGIAYPQVTVDPSCDLDLAVALGRPGCCLFDVAAGGRPRKLLLWGDACTSDTGFLTWSEEREACLTHQGERVINDDC